jgi:hypothetical protein
MLNQTNQKENSDLIMLNMIECELKESKTLEAFKSKLKDIRDIIEAIPQDEMEGTPKKDPTSKFDESVSKWCRSLNEKIPVAPLTTKEKELLQETLVKDGLCENDFVTMAIREKLGSTNQTTPFHDNRRPLPL